MHSQAYFRAFQRRLAATPLLAAALAVATAFAAVPKAHAGGFYLFERGVRPLARGGAYIAGVDDPSAMWLNPAGMAWSGDQVMGDLTLTYIRNEYTRLDSGGNFQPTVVGTNQPIPIPALGVTFDFGLPNFTFGLGTFAPNAALMEYPEYATYSTPEADITTLAPQRYSLMSLAGSVLTTLTAGAAWRPIPQLAIGLAGHLTLGTFGTRVAISSCDGVICNFPEDTDYDAVTQLFAAPIVAGAGLVGVTYDPGPVRIGLSVGSPFELGGHSTLQIRLPEATLFDGAVAVNRRGNCADTVDSDREAVLNDLDHPCRDLEANMSGLWFPLVIRAGVELRMIEHLKIEAAATYEHWQFQENVTITPNNVWVVNALGGGLDYQVGDIVIPRRMQGTVSVRLGGEWEVNDSFRIMAGGYYENSSFSDRYLTVLTLDSDKIVVSAGVTFRAAGGLWTDITVGYGHLFSRQVRESAVPQPTALRPQQSQASPYAVTIGNGDYQFYAPFIGVGFHYDAEWGELPPDYEEVELATPSGIGTTITPDDRLGGSVGGGGGVGGGGDEFSDFGSDTDGSSSSSSGGDGFNSSSDPLSSDPLDIE